MIFYRKFHQRLSGKQIMQEMPSPIKHYKSVSLGLKILKYLCIYINILQ